MERIQSAIAKARAEREGRPLSPPAPLPEAGAPVIPVTAPETRPSAPAEQAVASPHLWTALPEISPSKTELARHRIVTQAGGSEAASFDVLRTRVLQQARANNWKRVAITSPTPACGKSTISLNLGFSFARQSEMRAILCEMDLRRPSLSKMLNLGSRANFAEVLEGSRAFEDCAVRYGEGFAIAANAKPARNPAELLYSDRVTRELEAIEASYGPDIMLFDMPPMLVSDDTIAFMGNVDAVLLVAAAEETSVKEIDTCERELAAQTNVMGVILNKCRYMGSEYGYGYGYY